MWNSKGEEEEEEEETERWKFTKFQLETYDFYLYKGFSKEKIAQICQILKKKKNFSKLSDFYDKFQ